MSLAAMLAAKKNSMGVGQVGAFRFVLVFSGLIVQKMETPPHPTLVAADRLPLGVHHQRLPTGEDLRPQADLHHSDARRLLLAVPHHHLPLVRLSLPLPPHLAVHHPMVVLLQPVALPRMEDLRVHHLMEGERHLPCLQAMGRLHQRRLHPPQAVVGTVNRLPDIRVSRSRWAQHPTQIPLLRAAILRYGQRSPLPQPRIIARLLAETLLLLPLVWVP